jgi:hypothetical protein
MSRKLNSAIRVAKVITQSDQFAALSRKAAAAPQTFCPQRSASRPGECSRGDARERAEPIADWFARMVTPAGLPNLYRAFPSLMALLVVEVRSPGTALIDLNRRKTVYEKFGVPSYRIVDPEPARPELTVFELRNGGYVLEATSTQPLTVSQPFTVLITPADLTKGLPL